MAVSSKIPRERLQNSFLFRLLLISGGLLVVIGCKSQSSCGPAPGETLKRSADLKTDCRRLLFAQIVEDHDPNVFSESAILESQAFKYFLKRVSETTHDQLRKRTSDEATFDRLMSQPGLYRGQVVTLPRGVILEVTQAQATPSYNLPPGYTILPAVFIDSACDVYALRILCPPNSKLYEKLRKGIETDELPVARLSGYFMKLYARRTAKLDEPPWRRPLLICPEPEFSQAIEPRHVWSDMVEAGVDKLLPSERLDAPGAEERLIVEVLPARAGSREAVIRIGDSVAGSDIKTFLANAVVALRKRLPPDQAPYPSAVVLIAAKTSHSSSLNEALMALKAAGVSRLSVKSEP
ncbi:MAG: hypothetical protein V1899_10825 [Planctomycetota bacterium]